MKKGQKIILNLNFKKYKVIFLRINESNKNYYDCKFSDGIIGTHYKKSFEKYK